MKKQTNDFGNDSVPGLVLRTSIPFMFAQFVNVLYSIVDRIYIGNIPQIGSMLLPMHLPTLLCGFLCGGPWGAAVGFLAPLMRSAILGMPPPFPTAVAMAVEMAVYGLVSGLLYARLPKNLGGIYTALISAMAAGRLAWGAVMVILTMGSGNAFTLAAFWAGAVANAIPGIILQLAAVPALVMAVQHVRQPVPQEG